MHVSQRLARSRPLATTATLRRGVAALLAFGAAWHDGARPDGGA